VLILKKNKPMSAVRPKKSLGQHFLKDKGIAQKIVNLLQVKPNQKALEIGAGMGVLTEWLCKRTDFETFVVEIDRDSVAYLKAQNFIKPENIIEGDFLKWRIDRFSDKPFSIIGNLPYNISSQIFFKVYENCRLIPEVVCMIQKEVAERIAAPHGSKTYGILSVLLQTYYDITYEFTVPPHVFLPPPKVQSAVISFRLKSVLPDVNPIKLKQIVKMGFNQRRKTLRNALKALNMPPEMAAEALFDKRAEQLSVQDFLDLTNRISAMGL